MNASFKADDLNGSRAAQEHPCTITWGEYANPSFEAVVETVGKARQYEIMSIEQCVEEMYGDTMSKEDKAAEVGRIKSEQGVTETEEPSAGDLPTGGADDTGGAA